MQVIESFREITFFPRFVIIKVIRNLFLVFERVQIWAILLHCPGRSLSCQRGILLWIKDVGLHWEEILWGSLWLYSASLVCTGIQ